MPHIELRPDDYRPAPPPDAILQRYGIGMVGCGSIARGAHLPAYRDFGYRVLACCDILAANAEAAAKQFGIPRATTRLEDLLDDPAILVIDLAVHASQRVPLVQQIAAAGKHILSQKPFALNFADAHRMVEICREAGVTLMINQQARWAPAHRALKILLEREVLGHVYGVLHLNRSFQDVPGSWFVALEHFNIVDHGIHYIDLSRYFTGLTPLRVKATTTMVPGQVAVSPMIYTILCEYAPEERVMSTLHFNNIVHAPHLRRYEWFVDGTEGSAAASQTELVVSFRGTPDEKQVFAIQGRWFPDAFGGSMGEMLRAVAEGREPETSGRDNLSSIRIAYAAVESSQTGRTVELEDIGR
jgi:predicted dehydrogenase